MDEPLNGAAAKIVRATKQLEALRRLMVRFLDGEPKPYTLRVEVDNDGRDVKFYVDVACNPPLLWSVLIGEYVHNLRSALDHTMWQLVLRDGGSPHDRTQFPIFFDPDKGEGLLKFDRETLISKSGKWVGSLYGLGLDSITLLKGLQPDSTGEKADSPLWQLHKLSIFDKHQNLHFAAVRPHRGQYDIPAITSGGELELLYRFDGPFDESTLAFHCRLTAGQLTNDVEVKEPTVFLVVLGDDSPVAGMPVIKGLNDIRKRVIEITKRIDRERF